MKKRLGVVRGVLYVARTCCCLCVEYEVESFGRIVVVLELAATGPGGNPPGK